MPDPNNPVTDGPANLSAERQSWLFADLLRVINLTSDMASLRRQAADWFQRQSGCEAIGVRWQEGEDFPYCETRGFSGEFVERERNLCLRDATGDVFHDSTGNPILECMCGNIICGRFNPQLPFFTCGGSFWTNSTTELLASTSEADRQARTRNRCHGEGYESVALIPLCAGKRRFGLLQLNDRRPNRFTPAAIALWELLAGYLAVAMAERQTEEELRQGEERFRALFDSMAEGVAWHELVRDKDGQAVDYRIVNVNPAYERHTGISSAQCIGRLASEVYGSGSAPYLREFANVAETGESLSLETYFPPMEKYFVISVVCPKPGTFATVFMDITQRKRTEAALRAKTEELDRYFNTALDLFCIADTDGCFRLLNRQWEFTLGYSLADLQGQRFLDFVHPDDVAATLEAIARLNQQEEVLNFVNRYRRHDGSYCWIEWRSTSDGKLIYAAARDITERKRVEEQLLQAQKMESVGRLAGGVAHDFNNLLTVINGYSHLLLKRMGAEDPQRKTLTEIAKAGERAAALTRQLLAFSRKQVLEPRIFDLNEVVRDMTPMLKRLLGEDIDLQMQLTPDPAIIRADRHQLEQVIMNLIANARDAMPSGGVASIQTAMGGPPREDGSWPETASGQWVVLSVADNGVGMTDEVRQNIFEPFYTTKDFGQGTGLGLSTVQGIVEQSGGVVDVVSQPGEGTTFRIFLRQAETVGSAVGAPAEPAMHGSETILVVEDEPEVRDFVAAALRSYGYQAVVAKSSAHALSLLAQTEHLGLVLTDVVMPGTNGAELVRQLRAVRPEVKVLYMSGYTADVMSRHGIDDREAALIAKPFSAEQLAAKVREVLEAPLIGEAS